MKKTFTFLKIMRPLLLALCCIFGAEQAMAQYTASLVQKGGYYTALTKDNSGNLYVVRYDGTTYQLVKWAGGNPASQTVIVNSLAFSGSEYPWGIAVNPTNGDVFVTNPDGASQWQIIRVPGGTGTPTVVQSGNYYSTICLDNNNNLLTIEYNSGASSYRVRRYSPDGSTFQATLYDGLPVPSDGTYPYAMAVDANNNIFITNFYTNSDNAGESALIKLTAPGYAATPVQTGARHFSSLYFDTNNNLYTIEQASAGSATYQVMKYSDPAGTGTPIYSPLSSGLSFYPWGITEINGALYLNDGAATTDINGIAGANGQLLMLTPPNITVTSINRVSTTPTNAATVQFLVTFSGTATGVSASNFTPTVASGSITGASIDPIPGSGNTRTVTVNTGSGSGVLRLDMVNNTGITPTVTGLPFNTGQTITIDKTGPAVSSVTVPAAATYKDGDVLTFQVVFNENITVTPLSTATLDVTIGSTTRQALLTSVTGSNTAVFTYTLQMPDTDNDGIQLGAISLNGSTIRDALGNDATLTLNGVPSTAGILVDTKHPIPTISSAASFPVTGPFTITITFDEDLADNMTISDLTSIGVTASNLVKVDNHTWTAQLTPPSGNTGSSTVSVLANTVHDAAGNGNMASNSYGFSWDTKAPAITVTPPADQYYKTGDVLSFTVTYDENVVVTGAPTLPVIIDGNTRQAAYAAGANNQTLIFSYTIAAGEQDLDGIDLGTQIALNGGSIKDAAGNDAAIGVTNHYAGILVDGRAPTVASLSMPGAGPAPSGYYYAGTTLSFTLTTSEVVTVTGTPTFDVIIGSTTRQATYVSGSGSNTLTFSYTIVDGDNDENGITTGAQLNIPGGSSIRDAAGNDIAVTLNGIGDGSAIRINTVHPTVTLTPPQLSTVVAPFILTITFSEQTTDALALADFVLTGCSISGLSTTDNITWTGLITPDANAQGAATIDLPADVVHNIATNGNQAAATYNFNYDTKSPAITSITPPANGTYKAGQTLTFTITYDDNFTVTGGPTLPVIIGSNTRNAALTGSTANTLTFSYTLIDGELDADGIALGSAIALNGGTIKDAVGHDAALSVTGSYPGILVDAVRPTVTSVAVPANGYHHLGDPLTFTVNTSENITVTGTPQLNVVIGSVTRQATYVSGSGSSALVFTYTIVAGDNDMDGITLGALDPNGGTLQDAVGNDMVLTLNGVAPTNGVFVNTDIPSVTLSAPTVLNGPWTMTVTFSELVAGLAIGDFSISNASLSGLSTSDNITYTVTVTPSANGTVTISLPANSVVNAGNNANSASNTISYTYDGIAPAITSVNVPAPGGYNAGDALNFTVNFDENVTVTGTPYFVVTIGSTNVQAVYTGGTGTTALTFSYTVSNGELDMDGITVGSAITLNGGTIKDAAGNNATLTLNSVGSTTGVIVDAVAPVVTSVSVPVNGYYKGGQQLNFTVHFSENVTPSAVPSIPVIIGSNTVQADYVSGSGTNALVFTYTVQPGDMDMDGIAVGSTIALNSGTIKDGVGNDAVLTITNVDPTNNVFVNTATPTVTLSGTPVLNGPWTMTITFSEAVTGFTSADINTTNAGVSAALTGDNITYTVLVTPTADGAVSLSVPANVAVNVGDNGNAVSNTINYIYDGTAPAVTSVSVPANGTYSTGDVLDFDVNFSEQVAVTGTPSFPVTIGSTTVQATYAGGTGTNVLSFSYTVQTGDLDMDGIAIGAAMALNGSTIKDLSGNDAALTLNGAGSTSGVLVDAVAPVITSVAVPANGYYKAGDVLNFTVNFNENITVTGTPSIPLTIGATIVQATYVSGSGASALTFSYTVQPGENDMDGIAVGSALALNGGTLKDGLGNDAAPALNNVGNTGNVFVNTVTPAVTLSGTPVLNGTWTMTITFSEAVTGFTLADITATNATLSNLATADNITYTALVTAGADGAVTISIPANVALNIGGNGNSASNSINYIHDGSGPAITSVTVPANGTYKAGDALNFTANFNENVVVTGTPSLPVQIGATIVQAAYTGGTGSNALTFSYTVLSGQADNDGIGVGAPLVLNGGAIVDAANNNAVLTLSGVGNTSAVLVDAEAPVITSVAVPANGYYKAGDALYFTVQFSEDIISTSTGATLPLTIGTTTVQAVRFGTPTTNSIVFRYVVQTGQVDMDGIVVGAALVPGGVAIRDAAGNDATLTLNNVGSTSNVFVLANRPTADITGLVSVRQPWTATITFSHAVTGFALADIALMNAVASNLQTSDNITYTVLISPVTQGGVSIEIPANVAQDVAGNQNLPSNRLSYYYDPAPPVITSVEVPANGYYKQGDVLNFAVNWNEVVRNNITPTSLTLPVIIGGSTVQAAYIAGFNSQRITFAYTVQAGQMDLDGIQLGTALQVTNAAENITDLSGNPANLTLNNAANTSGVFVNTARPSVTLSSTAAARLNAPFTVTATFSEAVTQLAATDFTLSNATASNLQTIDNITYTVLITPTADGAVSISLPADAAVNVVGNGNTASNSITRTYDATPPAIAAGLSFTVSQFSAAGTVAGTVTATDASGTVQDWAIATDGSGGAFQINAATGVITVRNTAALNALVGTTVTLGITVSDGLNTSASTPVSVRVVFVNQAPTLDAVNNITMCADTQDHTVQLTGASAVEPGQTYTITATANRDIFDVLTVGAGNVLTYRLRANAQPGATTVAVTIRDNGGTAGGGVDSLRRTFTLTVNALPAITITSDKGTSISKGDIVKLTASGGSSYVWTAADGIISGQNTAVLEVRPMVNTTYEVTATTSAGCTGTGDFALNVVVDFKVDAINILTPNGDGRNDRWVIRNLDSYTDNEVKIFDRAGRMIYNRRNYSNDWDGTVNGSPLAEGTYYYILTIQNGAKTATGYITIVRDRN